MIVMPAEWESHRAPTPIHPNGETAALIRLMPKAYAYAYVLQYMYVYVSIFVQIYVEIRVRGLGPSYDNEEQRACA